MLKLYQTCGIDVGFHEIESTMGIRYSKLSQYYHGWYFTLGTTEKKQPSIGIIGTNSWRKCCREHWLQLDVLNISRVMTFWTHLNRDILETRQYF